MGLGLSVSHSIISEIGGELTAESSDAGARFSITLPHGVEDKDA